MKKVEAVVQDPIQMRKVIVPAQTQIRIDDSVQFNERLNIALTRLERLLEEMKSISKQQSVNAVEEHKVLEKLKCELDIR